MTLDRFGLNKMLVVVTEHNKVYGIESMSGKIMWQLFFPGSFDPSNKKTQEIYLKFLNFKIELIILIFIIKNGN